MSQTLKFIRWQQNEPGTTKAFSLSLIAHALLVLLLTVGLYWKNSPPAGIEVELWDNVPQPTEVTPAPPVIFERIEPVDEKAEIVTKKQKKEEPVAKPPVEKKREEAKPTPPKEKEKPKAKVEPIKEKPKTEAPKDSKPKEDRTKDAQAEKDRLAQVAKLRAAAGEESGSGGTIGTGTSAGGTASPGYADMVRKRIKPLISFNSSAVEGNPATSVSVELAPDGRILSKQITRSSGISDWDAAVILALDQAGTLPKDESGKVPRLLNLVFRPKD